MSTRVTAALLALALTAALGACASADSPAPSESPAEGASSPTESSPAPGLYDREDGRAEAIGVLTWVDLEGGFWAVTDTAAAREGGTVAVITNGDELARTLTPLEGKLVSVVGERFDGVSIRMAGPEIVAETVEELSEAPKAAE